MLKHFSFKCNKYVLKISIKNTNNNMLQMQYVKKLLLTYTNFLTLIFVNTPL